MLASEPLPPLPKASDLIDARVFRRPGEMHEAYPLSEKATARLSISAQRRGVALDVAASLLLEAGLVVADIGPDVAALRHVVEPPTSALTGAEAGYVRSLTIGCRPGSGADRRRPHVAIPVRLLSRLADRSADDLIDAVDLETAISWEIAAIQDGRTMTEWVFRAALRKSA